MSAAPSRLLMREQPDLIVLGGDYVTWGDRQYVGPSAEALAPLSAPHGVFGILGNHDDDHDMPAALARNGVADAEGRAHADLTIRNEPIDLVGIRFWTQARAPTSRALAARRDGHVDPARARSAAPREAAALKIPLVLSGHTHGGQVVLPVVGAIAAQKFPVIAGLGRRRDDDDVRQPRRRNDLRAGADQLSAGSRGAHAPA